MGRIAVPTGVRFWSLRSFAMPSVVAAIFLVTVVPSWLGVYSSYIQLIILYIGVNIILTVSLNLINGYMGEFSVGHAGFMGVGAYITSILTVLFFVRDDVFGAALLPGWSSIFLFPLTVLLGGVAASLFGLLVAIPSFRTRGDYLAIITLAVNFIFVSSINNLGYIGGPRGFMGMRRVTAVMESTVSLPWLMIWTFIGALFTVFVIRNFVSSTFGKGTIAIREDEIACELMTVNTRRVKMTAFMLSCGLAGIAGGLFAHIIGFVNPVTFGIIKSTEVMVMVYLGGMASISGSVLSATGFTILLEATRPLEQYGINRWMFIPVILILLMLFRPTGLMGNRELSDVFPRLRKIFGSQEEKIAYVPAAD
jgi:branched-chain amino acid transport system permease protein